MKQFLYIPLICFVLMAGACTPPQPVAVGPKAVETTPALAKQAGFSLTQLNPDEGDLTTQLQQAVEKAAAMGQTPFVEFYADWCPPCLALRKSLDQGDPLMVDAFEGVYIIQLDTDAWDKEMVAAAGFEVQAIPLFFALDETGQPTGAKISGGAWGEDIPENMAPPLKAFFNSEG